MNPIQVKMFLYGLITQIEDKDIRRGSASDCLNWHFLKDHIEIRRGRKLLGTNIEGSGRVTGLRVARKFNGSEIVFFTGSNRKAYYYDPLTETSAEIGSTILPAEVIDSSGVAEDISIEAYNSLAGNFVYLSSPNLGFRKIPVANPTSVVDLLEREYQGKIKIKNSTTFLWNRKDTFGGSDKTGLYRSHVDATELIYQYTSKEVIGTGDGTTTTFTGTLAFKASASKETCFFLVVAGTKSTGTSISAITVATSANVTSASHGLVAGDTIIFTGVLGMTQINGLIGVVLTVPDANTFTVNVDSTAFTAYSSAGTVTKAERFIDDKSGVLTGQDGGTGTINYATGEFSVTFNIAPKATTAIYAQYFREDSTRVAGTSDANGGIVSFDSSVPRTIGQGINFRQDDAGGALQTVESFGTREYAMHEFKTWVVTLGSPDDTTGTSNLIYRDNVGISYHRSAKATGEGIVYVDSIGKNPTIRKLGYGNFLSEVVPKSISEQLDLNNYLFEKAVVFEWGDYYVLSCRPNTDTENTRLFMYHKSFETWEVHSFRVSTIDLMSKTLIAGDSASDNIFQLFSGLSDEDSEIENYYITGDDDLNKEGVKKTNIMRIAGMIDIDRNMRVYYSLDNNPFIEVEGTSGNPIIMGNGSYVDLSARKIVGSSVLGEELIGGGQAGENAIFASPYELQFRIGTGIYERIRLKFVGEGFGYLSISEYAFVDNRDKGLKLPTKYIRPIA
jgi:hypothetical protein